MKILFFFLACVVSNACGVTVYVDTSAASDLDSFGRRVKATLEDWYPYVAKVLKSPKFKPVKEIFVNFDPNYKGVAQAGGNRITGSASYYRKHKNDIGSMIHEMAHVVQQYPRGCPSWVTEGVADWVRFWHFEPNNQPGKPSPDKHYTNGYRVSAYFLNWVESRYKHMIYYINKDCREGTYKDSIFKRLTGKTVDEHWNEMMQS